MRQHRRGPIRTVAGAPPIWSDAIRCCVAASHSTKRISTGGRPTRTPRTPKSNASIGIAGIRLADVRSCGDGAASAGATTTSKRTSKTESPSTGRFATPKLHRGTATSKSSPALPAPSKICRNFPTVNFSRRWRSTALKQLSPNASPNSTMASVDSSPAARRI